jgi:hypothetical protein
MSEFAYSYLYYPGDECRGEMLTGVRWRTIFIRASDRKTANGVVESVWGGRIDGEFYVEEGGASLSAARCRRHHLVVSEGGVDMVLLFYSLFSSLRALIAPEEK